MNKIIYKNKMEFQKFETYTYVEDKHVSYLKQLEDFVQKSSFLPHYHLYPKTGLMNDPNGLAYFNKQYQFFYQWFPLEPHHGMKHWGHYKSSDLVHWEDKKIALIPDEEYEKNGCYSGNSIEKDGLLYLFYTANYKTPQGKIPKQAVAIMDKVGVIQKSKKNPIIDGAPEGMSGEIRDPFVFKRDGSYYMLLGAKDEHEVGQLLLYTSQDLIDWVYQGIISLPIDKGYMLECPSLIQVEGKDVLIVSVMGLEKEETRYQNQFSTIYLVGKLDISNKVFYEEYSDEVDSGFDFYASQAFYGKNNVPMMVAWFGCGQQELPSDKDMWKHGLTMPYELKLKQNRLTHFVASELLEQFKKKQSFHNEKITTKSNTYHLSFEVCNHKDEMSIKFGYLKDYWELKFDFNRDHISVDRSNLDIPVDVQNGKIRKTKGLNKNRYQVDVFVDNSFVEIFINEGEKSFAFRAFNMTTQHHDVIFGWEAIGEIAYYQAVGF
ncbi:glycoside hydrolase family 32 protein [Clostridium frigoris]|uniref:Sucrose-6-phosphate hydrolase n=1 Tax=Clostridium frigoris TaxID=205327 RepID=A0ABS6BVN6_9CLOT|nr:glycoside hydrolase family 32 protein [Clostridium frigoris]MBU3160882.1 glycoside hydrolase family 32 protein [Clostridium frigoris]